MSIPPVSSIPIAFANREVRKDKGPGTQSYARPLGVTAIA